MKLSKNSGKLRAVSDVVFVSRDWFAIFPLALKNLLRTAMWEDIIGSNLFFLNLVAMSLTRLLPVAPWCCSASLSSSCSTIRARILSLTLAWLWLVAPNLFLISPSLFATTNRTSHAVLALQRVNESKWPKNRSKYSFKTSRYLLLAFVIEIVLPPPWTCHLEHPPILLVVLDKDRPELLVDRVDLVANWQTSEMFWIAWHYGKSCW